MGDLVELIFRDRLRVFAVSYTHLDVYKRQGQKWDFINPQGVEDDMHMDIPAVVMPVRVGAD